MSKVITIFSLCLLFIGCRGEDDSVAPLVFDLDATGTLAQQTVEEAKKTIYGKWNIEGDISQTSKNSRVQSRLNRVSKSALSCSFYGIEFTDDRYILGIEITGTENGETIDEMVFTYGTYSIEEAADGAVSSVDLYETINGSNQRIARLTDIVVTEQANELTADFTIAFTLPDDFDFPCSDLSGDYQADKARPINGAEDAGEASNFDLLVNTWNLFDYSNSEGGTVSQMLYEASCEDYDDEEILDCDPATSAEVSFSAYGSYIYSLENDTGEVIETWVSSWRFTDEEQNAILIDSNLTLSIESLTTVLLSIRSENEEDGNTETWGFIRVIE